MRLNKLSKWLLLAVAAAWIVQNRRRVAPRLTSDVRPRLDGDDARDDGAERGADIWAGSREEPVEAIDKVGGFQVEASAVAFDDEGFEIANVEFIDADIVEDLVPSEVSQDLREALDDVDWRESIDIDQLAVAGSRP